MTDRSDRGLGCPSVWMNVWIGIMRAISSFVSIVVSVIIETDFFREKKINRSSSHSRTNITKERRGEIERKLFIFLSIEEKWG